jgi:hypothetical protein
VPPVHNHADRNSGYAERHQAASETLERFKLQGENKKAQDQAQAEDQKRGFRIALA